MDEDIKLVDEVLNGNIDSFNIIVNKYELLIIRFVYNLVRNKEASEDITQEVFITIYNKLYMYNKNYKFLNWILQIARNKCIDYIRKYKRMYESNIDDEINIRSKVGIPEESAEFQETKNNVLRFIKELEEVDRQIITLKYSLEVTFKDISDVLEVNESTVKRRYYRVRDKFKEFVQRKGERYKI
ncbi:MAG: sigma-70 family RNA polymerase sigma factor [Bacillota bacterium]|nr:sigma-70 family RNA polymerase sigma factor [Bacillota bacterium]